MQLDARLEAVASMIRADRHCDIGTDHGYLLAALLRRGKIRQAIAVEKTLGPLANAQYSLAGKNADVRLGDGLSVVQAGEFDSLSLCGMGGELIVRILDRHTERIPETFVAQPNTNPEIVRRWAKAAGYHVEQEALARGAMLYQVVSFRRPQFEAHSAADPAYMIFDTPALNEAALLFGPLNIARRDDLVREELHGQIAGLEALPRRNQQSQTLLDIVQAAVKWMEGDPR